jgi:hypothetical protein
VHYHLCAGDNIFVLKDYTVRFSMARFTAAAMGLTIATVGVGAATAQSVMKVCGDEWKQAKVAGTTNGETWPQFLAQCRAQQKGGNAAAPSPTPSAPAPVAPSHTTYTQAPSGGSKTGRECDDEYAANKAVIKASGQTKRGFIAACRTGNASIPTATTAPPASAAAPSYNPPPPAPAGYGSALAPAPAQTPVEPSYSSLPTSMTAGEFASDQQARARCPTDTVVWVNTRSRVYHFAGTHNYGHTKEGAYMCEADAKATGDRAAMNEQHP